MGLLYYFFLSFVVTVMISSTLVENRGEISPNIHICDGGEFKPPAPEFGRESGSPAHFSLNRNSQF